MIKKSYIFLKKRKEFVVFIILIIILVSLGKTLNYYFYTDDFAFLYYIQNNKEFGWPYYTILTLFKPIYKIFDINALPYFALGVLTYFFASIAVYLFIKTLSKNMLLAALSSFIFATGYIGIDQFSMIAVSIINNINVVNICITLIFLLIWIDTNHIRYYILTLLMFTFSMWLFPHRAFPLILFLPTLAFLRSFKLTHPVEIIKNLIMFVLSFAPFFYIAKQYGIFSYGSGQGPEESLYMGFHSRFFDIFNFEFIKEMFAVLGRFIFTKPISDFFGIVPDTDFHSLFGFVFFLLIIVISFIFLFTRYSSYARSLFIILFLTIEGYIGNMILTVNFDSNGPVNRYLVTSFISFSAIFPLFLFLIINRTFSKFSNLRKNALLIFLIFPFILLYSSLSRTYEDFIITERSIPAKSFFAQLKTYISEFSGMNILYFDKANYYPISSRVGNVLLSAATDNNINLAMPYKVPADTILIADTYDEFLGYLKKTRSQKDITYYTFYSDEKGLHNTREKVFKLLKKGSISNISTKQIIYDKTRSSNSATIRTDNVSSLTPINIKFSLRAAPFETDSFSYPYFGELSQNEATRGKIEEFDKTKIYAYLLARKRFYETVKVEVESEHIAKQNPGELLIDGKADTYWLSDQSRWEVRIKPWIKIDLGEIRTIGGVLWRQMPDRVFSKYEILTSVDGKSWRKVANLLSVKVESDVNLVYNIFDTEQAHYIMVKLHETSNKFSPGMAEIEVIDYAYRDINIDHVGRILANPFEYIKDREDFLKTYEYLKENAQLAIRSWTNKDGKDPNTNYKGLPILLDGELHSYEFIVQPSGTQLKSVELVLNFPANLEIKDIVAENKPL